MHSYDYCMLLNLDLSLLINNIVILNKNINYLMILKNLIPDSEK